MGDPLGSSRVSSQKQNREGVVGAQTCSCKSNPTMGDPLGSSCVSSQKQNCEGVVGAQSGQYRATSKLSPRCGGDPSRDVTVYLFFGSSMTKRSHILLILQI
ncbi:unnamed protein product [Malus baccata var. baccata]